MSQQQVFHVEATAHVDYESPAQPITVGVCATGKTEARFIVLQRLTNDGYVGVNVGRCDKVSGSTVGWSFGGTAIYSGNGVSL